MLGAESRMKIGTEFENGTVVVTECEIGIRIKSVARIEIENSTGTRTETGNKVGIDIEGRSPCEGYLWIRIPVSA
ncbi:hypothetical protein EVAR_27604_1 [Eumeta japonica]|uniref:Uncharacterized protein n=1 Tax=Eumeta variegata TaxID=151549 RepID=A0A4C1V0C1_EUMVA|nr:hypothetical protein EVAR_27604_1 [Eumeta japonica]